jgi:hypothetical protein
MGPSKLTAQARAMMQVIYNSDHYSLVEYSDQHAYELVHKRSARGTFFQDDGAARFMQFMRMPAQPPAHGNHRRQSANASRLLAQGRELPDRYVVSAIRTRAGCR